MHTILSLDFSEGWDLLVYGMEQDRDEKIFKRWLHYQNVPFKEFKEQVMPPPSDKQETIENVLIKARDILGQFALQEKGVDDGNI